MMGELRRLSARRRIPRIATLLALAEACSFAFSGVQAGQPHHTVIPLPQYHYGARIPVTCLNRSIEAGEHIQDKNNEPQYIPFPTCAETSQPLELAYGFDTTINCTISPVTDTLFHLLEFYIRNDVPLTCRLPSRPPVKMLLNPANEATAAELELEEKQEYVPLIFALAVTLQLSNLHVSTHLNVLLHSVPKHHLQKHDSGVIDSGAAYSTSPLSSVSGANHRLVIGDELPFTFTVRWFPTPSLPSTNGRYEWNGLSGHSYASMIFYVLGGFGAGCAMCTVYFWGVLLPKRLRGRGLGGATPLGGYGIGTVGNGWGIGSGMGKRGKRKD